MTCSSRCDIDSPPDTHPTPGAGEVPAPAAAADMMIAGDPLGPGVLATPGALPQIGVSRRFVRDGLWPALLARWLVPPPVHPVPFPPARS
jgi:hypothetical protein